MVFLFPEAAKQPPPKIDSLSSALADMQSRIGESMIYR
jgi:hypothetical protein